MVTRGITHLITNTLPVVVIQSTLPLEFFTNSPQCKNANIANFVLAVPLGID